MGRTVLVAWLAARDPLAGAGLIAVLDRASICRPVADVLAQEG